jgi:hypothetical protein
VPGSIGREVITSTFGSRERTTTLQEVTVRSFKMDCRQNYSALQCAREMGFHSGFG